MSHIYVIYAAYIMQHIICRILYAGSNRRIPFEAEDACGYRVRVRVAIEGRHTESSE